jgi:hypothetical protein
VRTGGRDILVERAKVILRKMNNYWAKVLVGKATIHSGKSWAFQLVLSLLPLGEKVVIGIQRFIKEIIPSSFRFIVQTPRLKFALVWGE